MFLSLELDHDENKPSIDDAKNKNESVRQIVNSIDLIVGMITRQILFWFNHLPEYDAAVEFGNRQKAD